MDHRQELLRREAKALRLAGTATSEQMRRIYSNMAANYRARINTLSADEQEAGSGR